MTPKKIGYNTGLVFDAINAIPENKNIICLAHYEEYKDKNGDSISYKYKSTGNMVEVRHYLSNCWNTLRAA